MLKDLLSFEKEVQKKIPNLCLISGKEISEAVQIFLSHWKSDVIEFEGNSFSSDRFLKEVESFSLFQKKRLILIRDAEKVDKDLILNYLKNINPEIFLLLISSTSLFSKEVQKLGGLILELALEKPWQKKERCVNFLKEQAHQIGYQFSLEAIQCLVDRVGCDREWLLQEFEKLQAYGFEKKEITIQDVKDLSVVKSSHTFWDLGESIFKKDLFSAITKAKALLNEGHSPFTLLASLRTQFKTLIEMRNAYEGAGESLLQKEFPYLKGAILQKKVQEIKNNSLSDLKRGVYLIFDAELRLRNSSLDPLFILEMMIGHYGVVSASELARIK